MAEQWNIVNFNEVHSFTDAVGRYRQGEIEDSEFLPQRLANGIYGQRQDDAYMVRVKLPAGVLNVDQLDCIGELIDKHTDIDFANITTRQDIQLHFVPLANISKVMLRLADAGLTTREACGNTVRNVTACPLAGQCDKEHVDVRPILNKTVAHFMRHPLTQYMPRKVKMSFSGCETDCGLSMIHDVGVVAVKRDGEVGFKVYVGGGLGHKPRKAIVVEEFVPEERLIAVIESVITLHNRHSDRKRRAKSRIKFLIDKFGEEGYREKYREVFSEVSTKVETASSDEIFANDSSSAETSFAETKVVNFFDAALSGKSNGLNSEITPLEIKVDIGDISARLIKSLSVVVKKFGLSKMRATQNQSLILTDVPTEKLDEVKAALASAGIESNNYVLNGGADVVACPGEWTCRLGITSSRRLAKKLVDGKANKLKVHISGCHNGCAQPQLADIGLHGEARRMFGKLIPYYQTYFGGNGKQNGDFGVKGPEIPASRAEKAITQVQDAFEADSHEAETFMAWSERKGLAFFESLLEGLTNVTEFELPLLLKDVDSEQDFRVLQLGGGECAGISEETVASQLAEASYEKQYRDLFLRQSKVESAVECAVNMLGLVGKSILFQQGTLASKALPEIHSKFLSELGAYPTIASSFEELVNELEILRRSEDAEAFTLFANKLDTWIDSFVGEDKKISLDNYEKQTADEEGLVLDEVLDLTEEVCPMHYIKARQALRSIENGQVLKVAVLKGEDERLVSNSLESVGFNIVKNEAHISDNHTKEGVVMYVEKPGEWISSSTQVNNNISESSEVA